MRKPASAPYLSRVSVVANRLPPERAFPFSRPFVEELDLTLRAPVTFFVGENGSGKSRYWKPSRPWRAYRSRAALAAISRLITARSATAS